MQSLLRQILFGHCNNLKIFCIYHFVERSFHICNSKIQLDFLINFVISNVWKNPVFADIEIVESKTISRIKVYF